MTVHTNRFSRPVNDRLLQRHEVWSQGSLSLLDGNPLLPQAVLDFPFVGVSSAKIFLKFGYESTKLFTIQSANDWLDIERRRAELVGEPG